MKQSLDKLREAVRQGPPYDPALLELLRTDPRAGARTLLTTCQRRMDGLSAEHKRLEAMLAYEKEARRQGFARVAGVDEAGRGPIAGPLVAAAVVLNDGPAYGLNDSKKLTAAQREELYDALEQGGHSIGVMSIEPGQIDRHGIQWANYAAMAGAAARLNPPADFLLVDGFAIQGCPTPQKRIIKGDSRSLSIAAASIIAKVTRDRIMEKLDQRFPGYGFAQHKGYGTREHTEALGRLGPSPAHRMSFAPLSQSPEQQGFLFAEATEEPRPCDA